MTGFVLWGAETWITLPSFLYSYSISGYMETAHLPINAVATIQDCRFVNTLVHAVALDQKRILPVSSLVNGTYGVRDVCLSVPTVVGRKGAEAQLEI